MSDGDVLTRARRLAARCSHTSGTKGHTAGVVQLPLWPEVIRGVPNTVLRSALFGVVKRGRRRLLDRKEIASLDGIVVRHSGPQLDQADLDVWEQCLHLARTSPLGNRIEFSDRAFLKAIGRNTGKSAREWLKSALTRLQISAVEIEDTRRRRAYSGQLIHDYARDEDSGRYVIEINPRIAVLFGRDGWTGVEWDQRLALKGQPLGQWLHGFFSTHHMPHGYKVSTLQRLTGSQTTELYKFRQQLRAAMARVAEATGWSWSLGEDDVLRVKK